MNGTPTILVIDPDAASRNYLTTLLKKGRYNVLTASLGKEGLVLAWQHLPQLIILDPSLPDAPAVGVVTRLRQDHRTANVPCIAFSSTARPGEMNTLLAAGCNEYLLKSSEAVAKLMEIIPRLLGRAVVQKKGGMLVVFLSAKGGTGTSSLCANLAMCMALCKEDEESKKEAGPERRVAVVDLVLPIGSIAHIVGHTATEPFDIVKVAAMSAEYTTSLYFRENLPHQLAWHFRLLPGSPDPESANQLQVSRIPEIIGAIQEAYDVVSVDLGRSLSRISIPVLQRADVIVLVLGPDLSTVHLTKIVWDYLRAQGVDAERLYPILNRAVGLEGMTKAEIDRELGREIGVTIPYLSGNMTLANNRHEPFITKFPTDSAVLSFQQASRSILKLAQRLRSSK